MHTLINPKSVFNSLQYGFSQAVLTDGAKQLFLSGQVATDKDQNTIATGMGNQTRVCLENIEKVLQAAGSCKAHVAMLRIYIKESANTQEAQNEIAEELRTFFGEQSPASSWVVVTGLALPEWLIEIEAQAVIPNQ
ncbi:Rid family hydrolase [Ignatzschineria rhizosphaerae]|uniref:Rid family hydrolase n=1 Tax=Ignatzschineria rhizosphaerae TaxID=2923279 RepID=A0ABY3X4G7_9GAMM|nr:Rid family hydrolase [Ignatzschineria rhizosphaerae]UNM97160.1 Rid family hydrolase [Ignatzschineria rhizosphaerae]